MATIVHIHGHSHLDSKKSSGILSRYHEFTEELEGVYFGFISMAIAIGSAIGGISLMFSFENHAPIWTAVLGIALTLTNNIVAILQLHARWVLDFFLLNLIVNVLLIVINTI